jgi:glycerol-3-phosphate dehydrogenase (NAD(P)+)
MTIKVAVIGGGSWGTTVAHLAAHNAPTELWCRSESVAAAVNTDHCNPDYLAGFDLHPDLVADCDLAGVVSRADLVVMGVPSGHFRTVLSEVAEHLRPWVPVVSLTKGLELGTRLRMSEVAEQVVPGHPVGVLTGPNLAKEILDGHGAASVIAMQDENIAERLQQIFSTGVFRVYISDDVVGCEIGGALKNVIALASGMADGLGTGDNTRAAVITRGLAELTKLGVAMGGRAETLSGLAGMGDLLATCISTQSRNRYVGEQLGRGRALDDIIAEMNQVAEGVKSAPIVLELAKQHGVPVPISAYVESVVSGRRTAAEAYAGLLKGSVRYE